MKPENAAFAARMLAAIDESGMSQSELARRVKRSPQAVTGWLKTGTISKALLPRVAAELGKDLSYFMPADPLQKPPRLPKRATGKGHGEGYKAMVVAEAGAVDQEAQLLHAFRKLKPDRRGVIVALTLLLAGCGISHEARIYNMADGTVIAGRFIYHGDQGKIEAKLPSGETCSGEYSTAQAGSVWGSIFGPGTAQGGSTAGIGRGSAVIVCPSAYTMECEYIATGMTSGHGFCNDNRRGRFRLMF